MVILDTCVLIFDALTPEKLSKVAKKAIEKNSLFCCDISLWEIAMLIHKKRLNVTDPNFFLKSLLQARKLQVLSITPEIALLSTNHDFNHFDPADRLIAATAIQHRAPLITCDQKLSSISKLSIIW